MSDNKKYFYMRLVDNFYDRPEMKVIERMENGYQYSTILLKMYLRSLKRDGLLMFTDEIPYDVPMLSAAIGHEQAVVKMAVQIFQKFKLVDIMDDGAIYMLHIQNFIGESTSEADRKRLFRAKIEDHRTNVRQISDKTTPYLDIELDIDKEIDIDICTDNKKQRKPKTPTPIENEYFTLYKNNIGNEIKLSGNEYAILNKYAKEYNDWADRLRVYFSFDWAKEKYSFSIYAFVKTETQRNIQQQLGKVKFMEEKSLLLKQYSELTNKKNAAQTKEEFDAVAPQWESVREKLIRIGAL